MAVNPLFSVVFSTFILGVTITLFAFRELGWIKGKIAYFYLLCGLFIIAFSVYLFSLVPLFV